MFKIVNKEIEINGTKYVLREKPKLVEVFIVGKRNEAERGAMFALERGKRPIFKEIEEDSEDLAKEMESVASRKSLLSKAKREYVADTFNLLFKPEGEEEKMNGIYFKDLINMLPVMPDAVFTNKGMKSDAEGFMKEGEKYYAIVKSPESEKYYKKEIGDYMFYAEAALGNLYDGWERNSEAENYFRDNKEEEVEAEERIPEPEEETVEKES